MAAEVRDPVCGCLILEDDLLTDLRLTRRTAAEVRDKARATGTVSDEVMAMLRALNRREGRLLGQLAGGALS